MSALGLAIMIVAGVVTVDIVLENTRNTDASIVGQTVSNVDLGGFLVVGVLIGIAFMLGVMLLLAGLKRANRKRQERKELERSYAGTATQAESLQEERDRLAAELEQERRARDHAERRGETVPVSAVQGSGNYGGQGGTGERGMRSHDTTELPSAGDAPIYPTEQPHQAGQSHQPIQSHQAGQPGAAGTATERRTGEAPKPSLKQRLLGS